MEVTALAVGHGADGEVEGPAGLVESGSVNKAEVHNVDGAVVGAGVDPAISMSSLVGDGTVVLPMELGFGGAGGINGDGVVEATFSLGLLAV